MENKIPEPELNIPSALQAKAGNKEFTLNWSKESNITGYEVAVTNKRRKRRIAFYFKKVQLQSHSITKIN